MKQDTTEQPTTELTEKEFLAVNEHLEEVQLDGFDTVDASGPTGNEEKDREKDVVDDGTPLGSLISASFVLNLTNIIIPVIIVLGFKLAGYKTKKARYQLNTQEIKVLEDPLQKYLEYVKINMKNPLYNLLLALSIVYGSKIIEGFDDAEKVNKTIKEKVEEKKEEKLQREELEEKAAEVVEKLAEENKYLDGYNDEQKALINATKKRRNRGYQDAIDWLVKKGSL